MSRYGVVAFAFGLPGTIRSNRIIADIAHEKARETGARIFTQYGVILPMNAQVTYMNEPKPGTPTLRIARAAVEWALSNGIDTIWVAAATPHIGRAVRDMRLAVSEADANIVVIECEAVQNRMPYRLVLSQIDTASDAITKCMEPARTGTACASAAALYMCRLVGD